MKRDRSNQHATRARPDESVPLYGKAKSERIDLGLAILQTRPTPAGGYSLNDLANFMGCSDEYVRNLEQRAFEKLRTNPRTAAIARELIGQLVALAE